MKESNENIVSRIYLSQRIGEAIIVYERDEQMLTWCFEGELRKRDRHLPAGVKALRDFGLLSVMVAIWSDTWRVTVLSAIAFKLWKLVSREG